MLVNARSAADIQRSVMNTENVPRARQLTVENGLIRLKGESPLQAMRPPSESISLERPASEAIRNMLQNEPSASGTITAMVNPISSHPIQESGSASDSKIDRRDEASSRLSQIQSRKPAVGKKPSPTETRVQKAGGAERKSGKKNHAKAPKKSPLPEAHQAQSTPWSSSTKGLPEWMKYLPKTESLAENLAIP